MRNADRILLFSALLLMILPFAGRAEISPSQARQIGLDDVKTLVNQSYHYDIEYDTVLVLPVHSKTIWKNDFYLLYFLKDDFFQAELEIDRKTGQAVLLSIGRISPPYQETHTGMFNYRLFNADSVSVLAKRRHSLEADSVRLVYFGVIPRLGKRGVLWEIIAGHEHRYQALDGSILARQQIVIDLNASQRGAGNFAVDEIRWNEIEAEIERLAALTPEERSALGLDPGKYEEYLESLELEKNDIIMRFPEFAGKKNLPKKDQ